jgi:hypothetical protein
MPASAWTARAEIGGVTWLERNVAQFESLSSMVATPSLTAVT